MQFITKIVRRVREGEVIIFAVLFLTFFITASGNIDSIDGTTHISLAREIVVHRKFDFGNDRLAKHLASTENKVSGKFYPYYNFGYALFFVPGVVLSVITRNIFHVPWPDFPFEYDWIITTYANMVNAVAVAIIGALLYHFLVQLHPKIKHTALISIIPLLVLSTHLFIQAHNHFPHPVFTLFFLLSLYYLKKGNNKESNLLKFSFFFLLTASIYNTTFIFLLPALYVYYLIPYFTRGFKSIAKHFLYITLCIVPAFIMQGVWNYVRFSDVFNSGYPGKVSFSLGEFFMRMWGMTFAPNMGIFINNPILLLVVPLAVVNIYRKNQFKNFSICFLVLLLSYIIGYSFSNLWQASTVYGPRFHTPILPVVILILCLQWNNFSKIFRVMLYILISLGILIQVPGILIPNFAFPYLSPYYCKEYQNRYYNPKCSPIRVGWSNLIRRRIKETFITLKSPLIKDEISLAWPQIAKPFRTIYPDPLFNVFSRYKINNYKVDKNVYNDIYSFALDIWWIKLNYYRNIL